MRARAVVASVAASVGVLAIGWQVGAVTHPLAGGAVSAAPVSAPVPLPSVDASASAASPSAAPTPAAPVAPAAPSGVFVGAVVDTEYGPVQVQLTVAAGAITEVTALQLPNAEGRSVQINNRAAPILHDEVLASQSAQIAQVSGATYTTAGYTASVQSALDQAGL